MNRENKRSFLERLTGSVNTKENDDDDTTDKREAWTEEEKGAELAIELFQTNDAIILRTFVAGVDPEDLDVDLARDMITIKGNRKPEKIATGDNLFIQELYWGSFIRTITLPVEIDVEETTATHRYGLLTIIMPKLDRKRQIRIKIKSNE